MICYRFKRKRMTSDSKSDPRTLAERALPDDGKHSHTPRTSRALPLAVNYYRSTCGNYELHDGQFEIIMPYQLRFQARFQPTPTTEYVHAHTHACKDKHTEDARARFDTDVSSSGPLLADDLLAPRQSRESKDNAMQFIRHRHLAPCKDCAALL